MISVCFIYIISGSDRAASMVGTQNGLHAILKSKYKHLVQINCCNHGIQNACEKSALNFLPLEVLFYYYKV